MPPAMSAGDFWLLECKDGASEGAGALNVGAGGADGTDGAYRAAVPLLVALERRFEVGGAVMEGIKEVDVEENHAAAAAGASVSGGIYDNVSVLILLGVS